MTKNGNYVSPAVMLRCELVLENSILQSSIAAQTEVRVTGQDVGGFYETEFFKHTWQ